MEWALRSANSAGRRIDAPVARVARDGNNQANLYLDIDPLREPLAVRLTSNVKTLFGDSKDVVVLRVIAGGPVVELVFQRAIDKVTFLDLLRTLPTSTDPGIGRSDEQQAAVDALPLHEPRSQQSDSMFMRSGQEFVGAVAKQRPAKQLSPAAQARKRAGRSDDDDWGPIKPVNMLKPRKQLAEVSNAGDDKENVSSRAVSALKTATSTPTHAIFRMPARPAQHAATLPTSMWSSAYSPGLPYAPRSSSNVPPRRVRPAPLDEHDSLRMEGFKNLGNTCYINAVLQALINLAPFTTDLLNKALLRSDVPADSIYRSLVAVVSKKRSQDVVNPRELKDTIARAAKKFADYQQEDAHEFLGHLLDLISDEVRPYTSVTSGPSLSTLTSSSSPRDSYESPTKDDHVVADPILSNFRAEVQHTISCNECGAESVHAEPFLDLSLDFVRATDQREVTSLEALFGRFFEDEAVEYTCEACGHNRATYHHRIKQLPRVLILHLKRFHFDGAANVFQKRRDHVTFTDVLNLADKCMGETLTPLAPSPTRPAALPAVCDDRPRCPYFDKCYRLNPRHLADFAHPDKAPPDAGDGLKRPSSSPPSSPHPSRARRKLEFTEPKPLKPLDQMSEDEQLQWALSRSLAEAEAEAELDTDMAELAPNTAAHNDDDGDDEDIKLALALSLHAHNQRKREAAADAAAAAATAFDKASLATVRAFCNYRLQAVVSHQGIGASNGHYICDVWDAEARTWRCYNDSVMSDVGPLAQLVQLRQRSSYMYFFVHDVDAGV